MANSASEREQNLQPAQPDLLVREVTEIGKRTGIPSCASEYLDQLFRMFGPDDAVILDRI